MPRYNELFHYDVLTNVLADQFENLRLKMMHWTYSILVDDELWHSTWGLDCVQRRAY